LDTFWAPNMEMPGVYWSSVATSGSNHSQVPGARILPLADRHVQSMASFNLDRLQSHPSLISYCFACTRCSVVPCSVVSVVSYLVSNCAYPSRAPQSCCYTRMLASSHIIFHSILSSTWTHLRRRSNRPNHPLQQLHPRLLPRLPQPNAHILQ